MLLWTLSLLDYDQDMRPYKPGIDKFCSMVLDLIKGSNLDCFQVPRALVFVEIGHIDLLSFAAEVLFTGSDAFINRYTEIRRKMREYELSDEWDRFPISKFMDYESVAMYSSGGVSFFPSYLVDLDRVPQLVKWIRVIPGNIQNKGGNRYERVRDANNRTSAFPYAQTDKIENLDDLRTHPIARLKKDFVVKETLEELYVGLFFSSPNGNPRGVGSAYLITLVIKSTGIITCPRKYSCRHDQGPDLNNVLSASVQNPPTHPRVRGFQWVDN
jgi:hypothetical protein